MINFYSFKKVTNNQFFKLNNLNFYIATDDFGEMILNVYLTDMDHDTVQYYGLQYLIDNNGNPISEYYIVDKGVEHGDSLLIYNFENGFSDDKFIGIVDRIISDLNSVETDDDEKLLITDKKNSLINKALGLRLS